MRLTLRTLLAYLDDILEPNDAREIGEKIAESPVASEMVEKIREVMRKRRVAAPELSGSGSGPDPNLVAEYLDNTLTPEGVAEVERICLDSEVHLAEVAASHQILTLVLGEPVDISATMRERMYSLGAVAGPSAEENGHGLDRLTATAATPETEPATLAAEQEFGSGLPDYAQSRSIWKRLAPVAALVVLAVWLGSVVTDPTFWGGPSRVTAPDEQLAQANGVAPAAEGAVEPGAAEPSPAPAEGAADPPVPADGVNPPPPADGIDPPPPADMEEPAAAVAPVDGADDPPAPDAEPVEVVPAPPQPDPPAIPPADLPQVMYTSLDGILLAYRTAVDEGIEEDGAPAGWMVMPRRAFVHPGEWIACPEPFFSRLRVGDDHCDILVNGGARLQSIGPSDVSRLGFSVEVGRVGLYRSSAQDAAAQPVKIDIRIRKTLLHLELAEPGTLCGVEVIPRHPAGRPDVGEEPIAEIDGGLFVRAGTVVVTTDAGQRFVMKPENGWLPWPADAADAQPGPMLAMPQWLTPSGPPRIALEKSAGLRFEKRFVADQSVALSIPAVVKDPTPGISEYAVKTLALTDNIRELLQALSAPHMESRVAAIVGIRQWLPRDPANDEQLQSEVSRFFRDVEAAIVYGLLWGFSIDDFRDPSVSRDLVDWLEDGNRAVEELALYHIRSTGRPTDYHVDQRDVEKRTAVARLRNFLDRNGAFLPPVE